MRFLHWHRWHDVKEAEAHFRKDNWPAQKALIISGILQQCRCKEKRILPVDPGLRPVKVYE